MEKKTDFKALSNKAKAGYIWDYYRVPILITAAILFVLISVIVQYVTYEKPIFNIVMINCNDPVETTAVGYYDFLEETGHSFSESAVSLNSTMNFDETGSTTIYDRQTLTMLLYAGGQDIFLGTGDVYLEYANQGVLMDLREVLSEETLLKYEDALIYATDEETNEAYPCVITLSGNEWLKKYDYYDTCYFGLPRNSGNFELAREFAEYLLQF